MKTISVVLGTYNGAKYLREQLDSILDQSYPPCEIIVQDDGSSDETLDIMKEYTSRYSIIKFYQNFDNHGMNENYFSAMLKTRGDFIAISDQDDIWVKDKLKWQIEAIGDHLLCSGISQPFPSEYCDNRLPNYNLLRLLYVGSALPGHTLLFSRKLLALFPDINHPPKVRACDVLIAIVGASYNSIAYVEKTLVLHRMHADSFAYFKPTNNKKSFSNILVHILNDIRLAWELRPKMKMAYKDMLDFMMEIESSEKVFLDAITMLRYQTGYFLFDFFRLQFFCLKHCEDLFYAKEKKSFFTMLRGLFFPISCYEYCRILSKRYSSK